MGPFPPRRKAGIGTWIALAVVVLGGLALVAGAVHLVRKAGEEKKAALDELKRQVVAGSDAAANEEIRDDDYGFRLAWPGEGYRMLGERDVAHFWRGALAGADHADGCIGVVLVRHLPGVSTPEATRAFALSMGIDGASIEQSGPDRFSATTVAPTGETVLYEGQVAAKDGHLLALVTHRNPSEPACFEPLRKGFSVAAGPIRPRAFSGPPLPGRGVGWRVEGRRFEGAPYALSVEVPEGFDLLAGGDLYRHDGLADVGIVSRTPPLGVFVRAERAPAPSGEEPAILQDERVLEELKRIEATASEERVSLEAFGDSVEMVRLDLADAHGEERLMGVVTKGDHVYEIIARYPAALRDASRKALPSALATLGHLEAEQVAKLDTELRKSGDPQLLMTESSSLRRGHYVNLEQQLKLDKPAGSWWLFDGEPATRWHPDGVVHLESEESSVTITVVRDLWPQAKAGAAHRSLFIRLLDDWEEEAIQVLPAPSPTGMDEVPRSILDTTGDPHSNRYEVATIGSGSPRRVHVLVAGPPAEIQRHRSAIDGFLATVDLPMIEIVSLTDDPGSITDHLFGYRFAPGGRTWSAGPDVPETSPGFRSRSYERGGVTVHFAASYVGEDTDDIDHFLVRKLEQDVALAWVEEGFSVPKRETTNLRGVPARRLWVDGLVKLEAYILLRDGVVYTIAMGGHETSDKKDITSALTFPKP